MSDGPEELSVEFVLRADGEFEPYLREEGVEKPVRERVDGEMRDLPCHGFGVDNWWVHVHGDPENVRLRFTLLQLAVREFVRKGVENFVRSVAVWEFGRAVRELVETDEIKVRLAPDKHGVRITASCMNDRGQLCELSRIVDPYNVPKHDNSFARIIADEMRREILGHTRSRGDA